ncbi:hypothetical protein [Caballeronia sp. PC1]|nr:hypothetical protein [Caballeronia sp. PC1]
MKDVDADENPARAHNGIRFAAFASAQHYPNRYTRNNQTYF